MKPEENKTCSNNETRRSRLLYNPINLQKMHSKNMISKKNLHRTQKPSRIPILASRIKRTTLPRQQRLVDAFKKLEISVEENILIDEMNST